MAAGDPALQFDRLPSDEIVCVVKAEDVDWNGIPFTLAQDQKYEEASEDEPEIPLTAPLIQVEAFPPPEDVAPFVLVDDKSDKETEALFFIESGENQFVIINEAEDMATEEIISTPHNQSKPHSKEKLFPCTYEGCKRSYTSNRHLKVHQRVHEGHLPYGCLICDKRFNTDYSRKAHHRTHTGERPYACTYSKCIKSFKTSGDLLKHTRTHTGERPFVCPVDGCYKSFSTKNNCNNHMGTHTGEKPYSCNKKGCGKMFRSIANLKNHKRSHTGEKPYACQFTGCEKRFSEYSTLYKHKMIHVQRKQFECSYCGKSYRQSASLKTHKRVDHAVTVGKDGEETSLEACEEVIVHFVEGERQQDSVMEKVHSTIYSNMWLDHCT